MLEALYLGSMDLQLAGKRALITGGSRGIGKAIARALADEGCAVAIAARDLDATRAAAGELAEQSAATVVPLQVDTGSDESVRAMVADAVATLGGLDILVNNAAKPGGQERPPALAEITDETFFDDVNVKVMGYLRCAREAAPHLTANGWGRIINISGLATRSTGSVVGSIRNVSVAALTKNLADQLGPHGVNVTVVHPGLTRTEATPGVVHQRAAATGASEREIEERMASTNSIRRLIDAEEIAWIVAFLASPRSIAINGDAIACGGGQPGVIHY
jgi:NAD(P)-dependent dehydrogenase (short-subunit alcohol dehydrogenase family)